MHVMMLTTHCPIIPSVCGMCEMQWELYYKALLFIGQVILTCGNQCETCLLSFYSHWSTVCSCRIQYITLEKVRKFNIKLGKVWRNSGIIMELLWINVDQSVFILLN